MNNVSWFLYISGMVQSLAIMLVVLLIVGVISAGVLTIIGASKRDFAFGDNEDIQIGLSYQFTAIKIGVGCLFVGLILVLVPSKNTMYMIAANQVGEQIIQLEEVQNIGGEAGGLAKDTIELLRQQIQEQLKKPTEPS